tara:strand:- start:3169 stop:3459 length:291 start_codon:yes stop_codon:yes gene_type:complete
MVKKIISKFKNLSNIKKFVLILVILFSIAWYWLTRTLYYYLIHTLGIPQIASIFGFSIDTIEWVIIKLPFYFQFIPAIIILPIFLIIFLKKKRKKK